MVLPWVPARLPFVSGPGEVDPEGASLTKGRGYGNATAMGLGDVFYDGESQARPALFSAPTFVRSIESLKETGQVLLPDPAAPIPDADDDLIR